MPYPRKGEAKQEFISRFMGDAEAKRDFPSQKQRLAVAYSIYEKGKKKKKTKKEHRVYTVSDHAIVVLDGQCVMLQPGQRILVNEDLAGLTLDILGFIPGVGEPFDFIEAIRQIKKGIENFKAGQKPEGALQMFYAAMNIVSMIPEPTSDIGAKLTKYGLKFMQALKGTKGVMKKVKSLASSFEPVWQRAVLAMKDHPEIMKRVGDYIDDINEALRYLAGFNEQDIADLTHGDL